MNKFFISFYSCIIISSMVHAQSIGMGTNNPHQSAALDISSSSKGMLTPRMTTAQRNAIASPAKGLLVFDNDVNSFYFYNGTTWVNLAGGSLTLPYTTSVNSVTQGLGIINSGSGTGIYGAATIGSGVYGRADASGGKGVTGLGLNGATAIVASASPGLALDVIGNLKISGGNTNPSAGAVLTSDASGNAVWKNNKIAFALYDTWLGGVNNYPPETWFNMQYGAERYDYGNNITVGNGGTNSIFTAPVSGLYHFDAAVFYRETGIRIKMTLTKTALNSSKEHVAFSQIGETVEENPNDLGTGETCVISSDIRLLAGEKVHVQVQWRNGFSSGSSYTAMSPYLSNWPQANYFNGHLVFAD